MKRPRKPQHKRTVIGGRKCAGPALIDPPMKYPRPAARRRRIKQSIKTIHNIRRHHPPPPSPRESRVIMKHDISPQVERPNLSVSRNLPAASHTRHYPQLIIRLHQRTIQLMHGPDDRPVLRKSRVQCRDPIRLVVIEHHLPRILPSPTTRQQKTTCPNSPDQ